jgi:hypothetical protein
LFIREFQIQSLNKIEYIRYHISIQILHLTPVNQFRKKIKNKRKETIFDTNTSLIKLIKEAEMSKIIVHRIDGRKAFHVKIFHSM